MKFDQDLCLNLQYDFGKMNSTLGSVVPLAMFVKCRLQIIFFNVCCVFVPNTCFQTTVVIYCWSVYLSLIVTRLFSSIYLKLFVCLSLFPLDDFLRCIVCLFVIVASR